MILIVDDDGVWDAEAVDDVLPYEAFYIRLNNCGHGFGIDLFCEVVSRYDHYASTLSSKQHWSYQVNRLLHEWPRACLRVEFVGR